MNFRGAPPAGVCLSTAALIWFTSRNDWYMLFIGGLVGLPSVVNVLPAKFLLGGVLGGGAFGSGAGGS